MGAQPRALPGPRGLQAVDDEARSLPSPRTILQAPPPRRSSPPWGMALASGGRTRCLGPRLRKRSHRTSHPSLDVPEASAVTICPSQSHSLSDGFSRVLAELCPLDMLTQPPRPQTASQPCGPPSPCSFVLGGQPKHHAGPPLHSPPGLKTRVLPCTPPRFKQRSPRREGCARMPTSHRRSSRRITKMNWGRREGAAPNKGSGETLSRD